MSIAGQMKFWGGICVKLWPIPFGVDMGYLFGNQYGIEGNQYGVLVNQYGGLGPKGSVGQLAHGA